MATPRPPLYRAARIISLVATVVALVLFVYVAATVYSATQVRPGDQHGQGLTQHLVPGGLELQLGVNFSNPGFLPISNVHLAAVVMSPGNVSLLARGSSPNITVGAGSVAVVPLSVLIPLGATSPLVPLLTHDAKLPATVWANITVSSLFALSVNVTANVDWGAPFEGLNLTPGAPSVQNGTVTEPFTLSFQNHASFALDGTLAMVVSGSGGCSASVPSVPLQVASKSSYSQVIQVTVPAGCASATWGSISGSYTSPEFTVPIPSEPIP